MAIATIPGGLFLPPLLVPNSSTTLAAINILNAVDMAVAWVVQAPKDGNIRKVVWGTRDVTTGATMDLHLETVDPATGNPSGTLFGTNTNASVVIANGDDNVVFTTTLTADAAVTAGNLIAVVLKEPGSSPGTMNAMTIWDLLFFLQYQFPYNKQYNGAAWGGGNTGVPMLMFEYDDGSYAPISGCYPAAAAIIAHALSTATTPNVVGARFQLPWDAQVSGVWCSLARDGDCALRVVAADWDGTPGDALASISLDKDEKSGGQAGIYLFDAPASLTANTWYRYIFEPTTTTVATGAYAVEVASAAQLDAYCLGQNWHLTTATSPTGDGDWTNYNSGTFRTPLLMGLIINGLEDGTPVSTGGGSFTFLG